MRSRRPSPRRTIAHSSWLMCSRQCSVKMPFRDASGSGRRWHIFRQRVRVPCSGVNPLASAPRERLRSHGRFPHRPHLCSRRSHQSALTRATCQDSQVPFGWRGENPPRLVRAAWSGGKSSPACSRRLERRKSLPSQRNVGRSGRRWLESSAGLCVRDSPALPDSLDVHPTPPPLWPWCFSFPGIASASRLKCDS